MDALLALATEEALRPGDLASIRTRLESQPPWSDLPFILLTQRGGGPDRNPAALRFFELLGNVTFLERPFHPTTFTSVAMTSAKGRKRQYEARARIEDLHEGEARLRTALLAGRLGSWELDVTTGVLTTSDACKVVFGRTPSDDFSYQDLIASIHPDDRARMQAAVQAALRDHTDYAIEYRTLWPDGTTHWAEIRARLVQGRPSQNPRLVGVSSDITERKTAEQHVVRLNEILEERVADRTRELEEAHQKVLAEIEQRERAESQLRQAQKMEAIGQLTGGVAHDFNNLLMAVLGNLDLLRKHFADDAKAARLIDGALQGARRGAALTQRLLAFARRQDLKVEPVDIADLVYGMRDLIQRSIGSSIELQVAVPEGLPPALGDANQIELAVLNLVVNSRDAMPSGGRLVIAAALARPSEDDAQIPPGSYVVLSVTDTGSGMDAETLRRATEPFFSTKELGKGTGLGLSMIHGLAVQLNGVLKLESDMGKGTRAELWLPVSATEIQSAATAPGTGRVGEETDVPLRILAVDDDALILMSTADMLVDLGHEVIEANSGEDALAMLKAGTEIDLIVTDYSMPRMNGVDFAKAARMLRPDLPILLATGYADLPTGEEIDLPRIGKPYEQALLAAEIRRTLARAKR